MNFVIAMNLETFLLIGIIVLATILIWALINLKKEKEYSRVNNNNNIVEPITLYNQSPMRWVKQYYRLENQMASNFIQYEQTNETKTFYILENHQVTQQVLKQFAIQNKANILFFKNVIEMANYFNNELSKPDVNRFLPDFILVSDLCGATQLMKAFQNKEDETLIKAKLIILSQNPNYGGSVAMTIKKPIDPHNVINILRELMRKQLDIQI